MYTVQTYGAGRQTHRPRPTTGRRSEDKPVGSSPLPVWGPRDSGAVSSRGGGPTEVGFVPTH